MQKNAHANACTSGKARMYRKGILQKRKEKAQPDRSHEASIDSTLKDIQCHGEKL